MKNTNVDDKGDSGREGDNTPATKKGAKKTQAEAKGKQTYVKGKIAPPRTIDNPRIRNL